MISQLHKKHPTTRRSALAATRRRLAIVGLVAATLVSSALRTGAEEVVCATASTSTGQATPRQPGKLPWRAARRGVSTVPQIATPETDVRTVPFSVAPIRERAEVPHHSAVTNHRSIAPIRLVAAEEPTQATVADESPFLAMPSPPVPIAKAARPLEISDRRDQAVRQVRYEKGPALVAQTESTDDAFQDPFDDGGAVGQPAPPATGSRYPTPGLPPLEAEPTVPQPLDPLPLDPKPVDPLPTDPRPIDPGRIEPLPSPTLPDNRDPLPRIGPKVDDRSDQQLTKACDKALDELRRKRIQDIDLSIAVTGIVGTDFPQGCEFDEGIYEARDWHELQVVWTASGLCHKPLYFEQVNLERYGHSVGPILQPALSGAHFFLSGAVLPYKMGLKTPNECVYALGYYRPGDCAPYFIPAVPLSVRGAIFQAGAVVGIAGVIP